jgi:heme/copper-type cytochrome/quinol oxidase subunit 2
MDRRIGQYRDARKVEFKSKRRNAVMETCKTETTKNPGKMIPPASNGNRRKLVPWVLLLLLVAMIVPSLYVLAQQPRVIQLSADHDNKFHVPGQKTPVITVKANEVIKFQVTSHKGTESDPKYPGCGHTFSIKELKDQGWDVCLKDGMNEFVLVAPGKTGDYKIECLAKCGKGHDDMAMKMTVQ